MRNSDVTYVLGIVFAAAASFFYGCLRWFHIQLPRYYPLEHTWTWTHEPGVPSQAWYAMQIFAFICGGLVTLIVYLVLPYTRIKETGLRPRPAKWLAAGATILIIVCMAYILYYEYSKWGVFRSLLAP